MDTGTFDLATAEPADRVDLERCPISAVRSPADRMFGIVRQTRRFRRARTASALRRDLSRGNSTLISPVDSAPYGATTLQRALRHRFSMVPPNSR